MKRHPNPTSEVFQAVLEPPHHDRLWFSAAEKTKPRSPRVSRGGGSRVNGGGRPDRAGLLPHPPPPGIPIPEKHPKKHLHLDAVPMTQPQLCFMDPQSQPDLQATESMRQASMRQANDRKRSDWLSYALMGAMFACTFLV